MNLARETEGAFAQAANAVSETAEKMDKGEASDEVFYDPYSYIVSGNADGWGWVYWGVASVSALFWWAVLLFDATFLLSQYGPIAACVTGTLGSNTGFTTYNSTGCVPGNYSPSTIPALMFASISLYFMILWRPTVWIFSGGRFFSTRFDATHWGLFFGIVAYFVENGNDFNPFVTKQRDNFNQNPVPNVNNTIVTPNWRNNYGDATQGASMAFAIAAVVVWLLTYFVALWTRSRNDQRTDGSRLAWVGTALTLLFIYISIACNVGPVWVYSNPDQNPQILSYVSKQCILAAVVLWAIGMFDTVLINYYVMDDVSVWEYLRLPLA